jgi:SAM-dependent methyltransferase
VRDPPADNRRLWNEWSDGFQALWYADTDEDPPPAPCPFTEDAPGGAQPDLLPTVEGVDFVELGCGGGQATVGTAAAGADRAVGVDFSEGQPGTPDRSGTTTASTPSSFRGTSPRFRSPTGRST